VDAALSPGTSSALDEFGVPERQEPQVAPALGCLRNSFAGDREQLGCRVDSGHARAALGGEAQDANGSAADV
jgi:hypothetical protein